VTNRAITPERRAEEVLALAARGMHVFPLRPGDKRPAVDRWEQRATTDPDRIRRCWTHAPYGVGIACGPSRLVVVDLDTAKGDEPPAPGVETGEDVLELATHGGCGVPGGVAYGCGHGGPRQWLGARCGGFEPPCGQGQGVGVVGRGEPRVRAAGGR